MYLVFTRMPGESNRRRLRSLVLRLCDVFRALINSLVLFVCLTCFERLLTPLCCLFVCDVFRALINSLVLLC